LIASERIAFRRQVKRAFVCGVFTDRVTTVLRKHAKAIGMGRGYSGHSMRATFITAALENGATPRRGAARGRARRARRRQAWWIPAVKRNRRPAANRVHGLESYADRGIVRRLAHPSALTHASSPMP